MNSDSPKMPREEMETWLTSLLLGELSAGEAAAVRELIKHDPELARLHDQLKQTIVLVRETVHSATETHSASVEPLKLSEERRKKLQAAFLIPPLKKTDLQSKPRVRLRLIELLAVLSIVAVLSAMLLPSLAKSKAKAQRISVLNNLKQLDAAKQQWALENNKSAGAAPTFDDIKPYLGRGEMPSVGGEEYVLGKVGEPTAAELSASDAKKTFGRFAANLPNAGRSDRFRLSVDGGVSVVDQDALTVSAPPKPKAAAEQLASRTWGLKPSEAAPQTRASQVDTMYYHLAPGTPTPATPVVQSPPPQPVQIVLPSAEVPTAARLGLGQTLIEPALTVASKDSANRSAGVDVLYSSAPGAPVAGSAVIEPSTGLPVAPAGSESKPAEMGEAFRRRYGGAAVAPSSANTANGWSLDKLREGLKNSAPQSSNRDLFAFDAVKELRLPAASAAPSPVIPSRSLRGYYNDVAGTPPPTETPGASKALSQSDVAGLSLKAEAANAVGATTWTDYDSDGFLDRTLTKANKPESASGLAGVAGRVYTNAAGRSMQAGTPVPNGGRLAPESNVYSVDVVGYAPAPAQAGALGELPAKEVKPSQVMPQPLMEQEEYKRYLATRFEREKIYAEQQKQLEQLKGLDKVQLREKLPQLTSDSELAETVNDVKSAEGKLAALQRESATPATELQRAQSQVDELKKKADSRAAGVMAKLETEHAVAKSELDSLVESVETARKLDQERLTRSRPYYDKKRELEDMIDYKRLLTRKMNMESVDLSLPKSAQVEILELADAKTEPSQTFWGGIRNAVSGDVERAARIKVNREKSDVEELSTAETSSRGGNQYDPHFLQTEFEIIESETILGKVAERLGLSKGNANKSEAVAQLRKQLDLQTVPNTTLLEIRAKADKPEEAAKIANTVAEVYRQWRLDKGQELVTGGVKALEERSRVQEEKIRKAKAELAELRQSLKISDLDASGFTPNLTKVAETDLPIRKPSTNAPIPQPEIQTSENNFSTFSLNVSDVSFKLAAASLEKGQMPDPASVRSEEFINAFDYRDPEPVPGAPIAFAWERVRYPFAVNRDLLRFSLKTAAAGRQAGRPLNIVLLLDNSGSMERADRVQIIREALRVLAAQLQPQDKLSVITFARTARLVADGNAGDKAGEVTEQVSGLTPQGGTNLEEAMNLAYETAARHYLLNGINRVVLLTDGAANLGDVEPTSLKQKVEAARKQGIALDCFGIGWEGFNDDLLEVLSRNGDGRYGFINSPEEAVTEFAGQLAGALKVAASDVKVQVEFNPARVTSYRQIGYAKHQLTKEQFRDNTVDAAEIAAQEAGNALYTVEVNPAGSGPLGTVRVRYKVPGTTNYREQAWDVPYTGNVPALEQSSPAMRLAASSAAFAEWLVASPFAGEVSPDAVLGYLRGVPEVFGADSRPKKLEWMIRQAKSIEGK